MPVQGLRATSYTMPLLPFLFYYLFAFTSSSVFSLSERASFITHPHLPEIPAREGQLLKTGARARRDIQVDDSQMGTSEP